MRIRGLNQISFALVSLVVGSIALLLFSIFQLRIVTIPLAIVGLVLAGFELKTTLEEAQDRLWLIIAAPIVCALSLLVAAILPLFWTSDEGKESAFERTASSLPTMPDSIPFPCGKKLILVAVAPDPPKQPIETDEAGNPLAPQDESAVGAEGQGDPQVEQAGPPIADASQQPDAAEQQSESSEPAADIAQPEPPPPIQWVDASTSAAEVKEVAVCVVSAKEEDLELAKDGKTSQAPDSLVIRLQVLLTETSGKVNFASWGESNFGDTRFTPTLKDDAGKVYPIRAFEKGTSVVGQARSTSLYPKLFADDFVVFEAPADKIEFLQLELPAKAFGVDATIRFQIPKTMLELSEKRKTPKGMRFRPAKVPDDPTGDSK